MIKCSHSFVKSQTSPPPPPHPPLTTLYIHTHPTRIGHSHQHNTLTSFQKILSSAPFSFPSYLFPQTNIHTLSLEKPSSLRNTIWLPSLFQPLVGSPRPRPRHSRGVPTWRSLPVTVTTWKVLLGLPKGCGRWSPRTLWWWRCSLTCRRSTVRSWSLRDVLSVRSNPFTRPRTGLSSPWPITSSTTPSSVYGKYVLVFSPSLMFCFSFLHVDFCVGPFLTRVPFGNREIWRGLFYLFMHLKFLVFWPHLMHVFPFLDGNTHALIVFVAYMEGH